MFRLPVMKILLTLVMTLGVLLLPGPLRAQGAVCTAGECRITATSTTTASEAVTAANAQLRMTGVREVQVRGLASQQGGLFLSPNSTNPLLGVVVGPGQHVDFRTVDGQRFRVQRTDSGQLRVRLREVALSETNRMALVQAFSNFGRVEIRGVDPTTGNRIRLEVRDGVVKKDEVRADRSGRGHEGTSASINNERARDRGKDLDHSLRGPDRAALERGERSGRPERAERSGSERVERAERVERVERMERPERVEGVERSGRH